MALTDRAANNKLNAARVGSNTDIAAPAALADQLDQRHIVVQLPVITTALSAAGTYTYSGFVADRAYKVISARVIAAATITANSTSYVTFNVTANNDAGGADTTLATLGVNTTNLAVGQSQPLTVQSTNTVAANQQVRVVIGFAGGGAAIPATTAQAHMVDIVVQEV